MADQVLDGEQLLAADAAAGGGEQHGIPVHAQPAMADPPADAHRRYDDEQIHYDGGGTDLDDLRECQVQSVKCDPGAQQCLLCEVESRLGRGSDQLRVKQVAQQRADEDRQRQRAHAQVREERQAGQQESAEADDADDRDAGPELA